MSNEKNPVEKKGGGDFFLKKNENEKKKIYTKHFLLELDIFWEKLIYIYKNRAAKRPNTVWPGK